MSSVLSSWQAPTSKQKLFLPPSGVCRKGVNIKFILLSVPPAPVTDDLSFWDPSSTPSGCSRRSRLRNAIFALQNRFPQFFLSLPAPPALALTFCPCAQSLSSLILWDNHLLAVSIRNNCCQACVVFSLSPLYSHYLPLALPLMSSDATQKQNYYFYYYSSCQQKKITSTLRPKPWGKVTILGMPLDISGNI